MRRPIPEQSVRAASVLVYVPILAGLSFWLTGARFPPFGLRGLWFYTAIVGLLLGRALVEPFFTRPADVVVSSTALALTVLAISPVGLTLDMHVFVWGRAALLGYASITALLAFLAILCKDNARLRGFAAQCAKQATRFGRVDVMYSILFVASLCAAYANKPLVVVLLGATGAIVVIGSPVERLASVTFTVTKPFNSGSQVTYEDPGIAVATVALDDAPLKGSTVFQGDLRIGEVVDYTITASIPRVRIALDRHREKLDARTPLRFAPIPEGVAPIAFVREETTIDHLVFHLPSDTAATIGEGELVEAIIADSTVLFQVTEARVIEHREFDVLRRVTRVEARKLGAWSGDAFVPVPWLPAPASLVGRFLSAEAERDPSPDAIGRVPGTPYEIRAISERAITHSTAIIGILGCGKTRLAWRLMDQMLADRHKCLVIDITGEYVTHFQGHNSLERGAAFQERVTVACRDTLTSRALDTYGESGNAMTFRRALQECVTEFVESDDERILIIDPTQLSQAASKRYGFPSAGQANIRRFSVPEVVREIAEAGLRAMMARPHDFNLCLVLEEGHSLVPEWNARASDDESEATSGTARSVMQGRKYGYGCLLVTQRTASVSKSILNQCNSMFAFRMYDATGAEFLEHYIGREYSRLLSSLPDRQVIAFGPASTCQAPIIIHVNDVASVAE